MGNNIILETKFVADISGSFYIPSYQRGYRWSETEVVRLLDDIYQNGKKNYCLQPVVVRKKEDQYELIDGQQRLTTLYLIYKYMKNVNPFFNEPAFTLSYQTRDQSEEFLKTLDMTKQDDNIDFWFIAKAYNTIKEWFEQDLQIRVMHLLHLYFSADDEKAVANIATLEAFFDCWCKINGYDNPTEFLESFMSYTHACGKIVVDSRYKIDIFEDCLHFYSDKSGRIRQFPLNRIVLLYAITIYLQHQNEVTYSDFVRRIRIVNNLIQNSEDEVSDRQDRNRIPAILQAVDAIVLTGVIDDSIEINFNVNQIQEEKKKIEFLTQNPDCTDEVFELEDHNMLKGQIGIIGLDNLSLGSRFSSLFACSWDKIDCALMTLGNYGQQERNKWRYQFASKSLQYAWDELFHKSANAGFENTHTILVELLKSKESFDDGILDGIISAFLAQCEKDNLYPWNYYYVKYPVFRPGSYGKMSNDDVVNKPYMFSVMQTKTQWSQNTYMPYLKEADDDHLSRDEMGQYLVYDDVYIVCENNSYGVYRNDDDSLTDTVTISQNEAGIDTEDRIIKLKKYIANMK